MTMTSTMKMTMTRIKTFVAIAFLLNSLCSFGQSYLLIPILDNNQIVLSSNAKKILATNQISVDSCKSLVKTRLEMEFAQLDSSTTIVVERTELSGGLTYYDSYTVEYYAKRDSFHTFIQFFVPNRHDPKYQYSACLIDSTARATLVMSPDWQYLLTINRVDLYNSGIYIHYDIFNREFKREAAGKYVYAAKIKRDIFYEVFEHFIKTSANIFKNRKVFERL